MIVIDASAMVEALVGAAPSAELIAALDGELHAPHLLDAEVISVLRSLERGRLITSQLAATALEDYWSLAINRCDLRPLADEVWRLRHRLSAYDAGYVALADALGAPLVTCDRKLAVAASHIDVRLLASADGRP